MSANTVADLSVYGHPLIMVALLPEEAQGVSFDELSCSINFHQGSPEKEIRGLSGFATSRGAGKCPYGLVFMHGRQAVYQAHVFACRTQQLRSSISLR